MRTSLNLGELPIIPFSLVLYASVREATADISCDNKCGRNSNKNCSHANLTQTYQVQTCFSFLSEDDYSVWK